MLRHLSIAAALVLTAAPLSAQQRNITVGAGVGAMDHHGLAGASTHVRGTARVARVRENVHLRAEVSLQSAAMDGSPFSCREVRQFYCLGRSDELKQGTLGANLVVEDVWTAGGVTSYFVLPGLGVVHRRAETVEAEGPTGTCISGTEFVSCPDNPPFGEYRQVDVDTGISLNGGFGLQFRVLGVPTSVESGIQMLELGGQRSLYLPLTLSVAL